MYLATLQSVPFPRLRPSAALCQPCLSAQREALTAELASPQSPHVKQHRQHGVIIGQKVLVKDVQLHDILEGKQSKGAAGWRGGIGR